MMEITRKGYVELYGPGGGKISQHTSEYEAIENIAEDGREGIFTIVFPDLEVMVTEASQEPGAPGVVGPNKWLDANPLMEDGFLNNDEVKSSEAQYRVVRMDPLGGFFEWFVGGGFKYTRAGNEGQAWFVYELKDYDENGTNISRARVTVDVG